VKKLPFISSKCKNLIGIFPRKIVHLKTQPITETYRKKLQISSLEDKITTNNPIRFIEVFVENICLQALGFAAQSIKSEGRPSPACLPACRFDAKVILYQKVKENTIKPMKLNSKKKEAQLPL